MSDMVMGGVSWRGESQEAAGKIIVSARLKMEDACILQRIPWTLKKKGSEKLCIFSGSQLCSSALTGLD